MGKGQAPHQHYGTAFGKIKKRGEFLVGVSSRQHPRGSTVGTGEGRSYITLTL